MPCGNLLLLLLIVAASGTLGGPLPRAGDSREGYDSQHFVTDSLSLDRAASDVELDLDAVPLGLPAPPLPQSGAQVVDLGRRLFFDRRLSANGTLSCAMCHIPEQGFTHQELATPVGIGGRSVRRNAPSLYNVAYRRLLFHDGRANSLEEQVWSPLLAANEMGNRDIDQVLATIRKLPAYPGLFEAAFGAGISQATVSRALADYQRALLAADAPFDRWYFGGREDAMNEPARRGFQLFQDKACSTCHTLASDHAHFTDDEFHDTGIAYAAHQRPRRIRSLQVAPGVTIDVESDVLLPRPEDLGRFEVSGEASDRWRYRTPSLRNVALTAPYMHDGSLPELSAVINYYDGGGAAHAGQDPRIRVLGMSEQDKNDLLAFLQALTGSSLQTLARDGRAAPIGDY